MKKNRILSLLLACALILHAGLFSTVSAAGDYTETPTTQYGKDFIAACEGQQWLINEVERQLNAQQKTISRLAAGDLSVIYHLGFMDWNLSGKIPQAIGWLENLETLSLGGNRFSNVPAELFSLTKLTHVDLSNNNYSGAIPTGFGTMAALKVLILSQNEFTGTIPADILANTNLSILDLSNNKLTSGIPVAISGMTGLKYLSLSENNLGGTIPDLTGMANLETLSLWNCGLTGGIHNSIYNLTTLTILDLAQNGLEDTLDTAVGSLTNLKLLGLGDNKLYGEIPAEIKDLTKLYELDLADNLLVGTIPDAFALMSNLREVHLENNKLRGYVPDSLHAHNATAEIYLSNNYLTGQKLSEITGANGVKSNADNFCDEEAVTRQYDLSINSYVVINETTPVNLYTLLRNVPVRGGGVKPMLPAMDYEYDVTPSSSASWVTVTQNAGGIFIQATQEIEQVDAVTITIWIKDNDGSAYSTATVKVATKGQTSVGPGGGGGGAPTPEPEEATVHHVPYINGFPDGEFKAEENVTREQVAKMLAVALELTEYRYSSRYEDVTATDWAANHIETASRNKYFTGYTDGTFKPVASITRAEFVAVIARVAGLPLDMEITIDALTFSDVEQAWYLPYLKAAVDAGYINGYTDGTFRPEQPIARSEAVKVVNLLLGRNIETQPNTLRCPFPDVAANHWAYQHILEASVEHHHAEG